VDEPMSTPTLVSLMSSSSTMWRPALVKLCMIDLQENVGAGVACPYVQ
jgi:hypothetical protein